MPRAGFEPAIQATKRPQTCLRPRGGRLSGVVVNMLALHLKVAGSNPEKAMDF
jgi:hypothetical protein